jgi:hypothetical protein
MVLIACIFNESFTLRTSMFPSLPPTVGSSANASNVSPICDLTGCQVQVSPNSIFTRPVDRTWDCDDCVAHRAPSVQRPVRVRCAPPLPLSWLSVGAPSRASSRVSILHPDPHPSFHPHMCTQYSVDRAGYTAVHTVRDFCVCSKRPAGVVLLLRKCGPGHAACSPSQPGLLA